jgi:SAM-dependent methyltransferase
MPIADNDSWYKSYDECQKDFGYLKHWWNKIHLKRICFFSDVAKNAVILDVGCGDGNLLNTLRRCGYTNLFGLDIRGPSSQNGMWTYKQGSMIDMPYADSSLDALIFFNAMHHLFDPDEYAQCIRECLRLLRPKGYLFLIEPQHNLWRKVQDRVIELPVISNIGFIKAQKIAVLEEKEELALFMSTDIKKIVEMNGFSVEEYVSFLKSFLLRAIKK